MLTARDIFIAIDHNKIPEIRKPVFFICSPSVYSMLAIMAGIGGFKIDIVPTKEAAIERGNELSEEGKTFCMLTHDSATICIPQSNGMVRVAFMYIDGDEVKWRWLGQDGE